MPAPVQQVAKSKLGSKLLLLLIPILIATGVISVSFSGGLPSITFNKERATAVGRQVTTDAIKALLAAGIHAGRSRGQRRPPLVLGR